MEHRVARETIGVMDYDIELAPKLPPRAVAVAADPLDALRASEYGRLDEQGQVYLDATGAALHAESQVDEHLRLLNGAVLGNPHSASPTSTTATELVERARAAVLRYFRAGDEYACIFTQNATGALRLVGEGYPVTPGGRFLATSDNHNSVNGIRCFARRGGAGVGYVGLETADLRVSDVALERHLRTADPAADNLFAYPAQSNFSGVKHPLAWIERAQARGWDVLLDSAAFAPTSRLDLSAIQPDFVAVSFYKMFGYPTGIGALIARRDTLARLRRPWYSGGTVMLATVQGEHAVALPGHAGFEDGTVNYLGIPAVEIGLRLLERVGIDRIARRVEELGTWLLDELGALRHAADQPAARVYGPPTWTGRGGTIAFNFLHPDGLPVDERHVDRVAARHGISLRTGCFCNPGVGEAAFGIAPGKLLALEPTAGEGLDEHLGRLGLPTGGAVRVSLGLTSNHADVRAFLAFADEFRNLTAVPGDLPPRHAC